MKVFVYSYDWVGWEHVVITAKDREEADQTFEAWVADAQLNDVRGVYVEEISLQQDGKGALFSFSGGLNTDPPRRRREANKAERQKPKDQTWDEWITANPQVPLTRQLSITKRVAEEQGISVEEVILIRSNFNCGGGTYPELSNCVKSILKHNREWNTTTQRQVENHNAALRAASNPKKLPWTEDGR